MAPAKANTKTSSAHGRERHQVLEAGVTGCAEAAEEVKEGADGMSLMDTAILSTPRCHSTPVVTR
jgi:hypothetical protein